MLKRPKIKICCIKNISEAMLAIKYGADAIGLVSEMPSGPGIISENTIKAISESVPKSVKTFLLTSKQSSYLIIEQLKKCRTNTVQIVDDLIYGCYDEIKQALPDVDIVKVIHITGQSSIDNALKISGMVDALLLDSGNPALKTKILGGTGQTHNWNLSMEICNSVNIPVFLAGGLNANNVFAAFEKVKPYGIDVCSSVRTNGKLNEDKLANFIKKVKEIPEKFQIIS